MRDRLIELLKRAEEVALVITENEVDTEDDFWEYFANYLLNNGVIVSSIPKTHESLVHGASFVFGGKCGENFAFGKGIEKDRGEEE